MEAWQQAVLDLSREIEDWVTDYAVRKGEMPISDSAIEASLDEPLLEITIRDETIVRLEPARFAAGRLPTVVNLYAYPSLRRVRLVGPIGGVWEVQSGEGVAMNYRWNKDDFMRLLIELAQEHVPGRV